MRRPERPADGLDAAEDPGEAEEDRASVLHGGRGVTEQSFTAMRVRVRKRPLTDNNVGTAGCVCTAQ